MVETKTITTDNHPTRTTKGVKKKPIPEIEWNNKNITAYTPFLRDILPSQSEQLSFLPHQVCLAKPAPAAPDPITQISGFSTISFLTLINSFHLTKSK